MNWIGLMLLMGVRSLALQLFMVVIERVIMRNYFSLEIQVNH